MTDIQFGTDGWRALIAREFTFENVARVATATARVMKERAPGKARMAVGYDRRFLAGDFARTVACCFAREGYAVSIVREATPTPVLSWCAKNLDGMAGAAVITAGHNPPEWSGFKVNETVGARALPETEKANETGGKSPGGSDLPTEAEFDAFLAQGKVVFFEPMKDYLASISKLVDLSLIRSKGYAVALDTMHGAGSVHLPAFLRSAGIRAEAIHEDDNPGFGGVPPEPVEKNLGALLEKVSTGGFSCGFATDGDADRLRHLQCVFVLLAARAEPG